MPRSNLTKNVIADAFRELLETTPIERVTVAAIAEHAGIRRQTFYYHFHDIYDLISWMSHQSIERQFKEGITSENWQDALLVSLNELRENYNLISRTMHGSEAPSVHRFAQEELSDLLRSLVVSGAKGLSVTDSNIELVTKFYVAGLLEIVRAWIAEGMNEEPTVLADRIARIVEGAAKVSLRNMSGL